MDQFRIFARAAAERKVGSLSYSSFSDLVESFQDRFGLTLISIVFFSCSLIACAGSEESHDRTESARADCIYQPLIRGYTVLDESNLIVHARGDRRYYHVMLRRSAHGLLSRSRSSCDIAIVGPAAAGHSTVCSRSGTVIFRYGSFGDDRIPIAAIRELTPEEKDDLLVRFGK